MESSFEINATMFLTFFCTVITLYNSNFTGHNDANPTMHTFVASPDIVATMSFAGCASFNLTDSLIGSDGKPFKFSDPTGQELSPHGYDAGEDTFQSSPVNCTSISVTVDLKSDHLQLIKSFLPWDGKTSTNLPILIKVSSKSSFIVLSLLIHSLIFQQLITFPLVGRLTLDTAPSLVPNRLALFPIQQCCTGIPPLASSPYTTASLPHAKAI